MPVLKELAVSLVLYILPAYGRELPQEGQNMRWRATVCYAGISSRTEGQGAPDKGTRDPSLAM
jgi:hypothetical protein